ncbi:VOC family protein [Paenibacillus sp. 481]|uniref:VOC family protein n=1 Tax=Paenibacillus sp. 481 TaxID=2835869 RepID=UPI001E58A728|nr:VOC family protein [Paenibacillus sp. 481]UHA72509.1 VOC family protein [Paenibacillus sp. 481]
MEHYRAAGEFCWLDIKTCNMASVQTFYKDVLNWRYQQESWPHRLYPTIYAGNDQVGGFTDLNSPAFPPGTKPHISVYVAVNHVDQTVARVEQAGGNLLLEPFDLGDFGRMATIQDSAGAVLSIWESRRFKGMNVNLNREGAPFSFELMTTDLACSIEFYTKVFNWTVEIKHEETLASAEVRHEGKKVGSMKEASLETGETEWRVCYTVKHLEKAVEKAQSWGAKVITNARKIPAGRIVVITDPDGNAISFIELEKQA